MNAVIHDVFSVQTRLVPQEPLELLVYVFDYLGEAIGVVDGVPEARRVHHRQSQLDPLLLYFHRRRFQLHRLLALL